MVLCSGVRLVNILDEFVKAEVSQRVKARVGDEPKSWDELFTVMAGYVGRKPDDPNVKVVESFLASLLQAPGGYNTTYSNPHVATAGYNSTGYDTRS